jgi:quinol monooxygenase YgiN
MIKVKALLISFLLAGALFAIGVTTVHAADEPVVFITRFFVNPGQEAIFLERNTKIIESIRKAEPAYFNRLQRSATNPSQYVIYEVYPSEAAADRLIKEAFAKLGPRPEGMLSRPPESEKLVPLGR